MASIPETTIAPPENTRVSQDNKKAMATDLRKIMALSEKVHVTASGSRWFVRFSQVEILEHWLVLIAFSVLGLTGFMMRYASLEVLAWTTNKVFGGIEALRTVHLISASLFIIISLFHLGRILTIWLVNQDSGCMLPRAGDASDLIQMIGYNLGLVKERPMFDRFTIEEKIGYWALLIFAPVMILTGLVQWFPTVVTRVLPADVILGAHAIHYLTATLGVLAVLTWHLYHTVIKKRNTSIFTGVMDEQEMKESHPQEYLRMMAAYEKIQNLSKGK